MVYFLSKSKKMDPLCKIRFWQKMATGVHKVATGYQPPPSNRPLAKPPPPTSKLFDFSTLEYTCIFLEKAGHFTRFTWGRFAKIIKMTRFTPPRFFKNAKMTRFTWGRFSRFLRVPALQSGGGAVGTRLPFFVNFWI